MKTLAGLSGQLDRWDRPGRSGGWLRLGRPGLPGRPRLLTLLALLAGLAGCASSPPTRFFSLTVVPSGGPTVQFAGTPVQVQAVHLPATLDRLQRVTLDGPRLDVHEFQQWGAPLADMTRRVLSEDLAARLPAGMVIAVQSPTPAGTRGLVVDVQRFAPDATGQVVLDATWSLLSSGGSARQPLLRRRERYQAAAGTGTDAQVTAMSELLGRLADSLAAALRSAGS